MLRLLIYFPCFDDAESVDYVFESGGIITNDDTILQYKSSQTLESKHLEKFVLSVFEASNNHRAY